jgi:hypothetical protein
MLLINKENQIMETDHEDFLYSALNDRTFSDFVVISSDGKPYHTHKVVLNVITYFRNLFRSSTKEKERNRVTLDIPALELEYILNFAYTKNIPDLQVSFYLSLLQYATYLAFTRLVKVIWKLVDKATQDSLDKNADKKIEITLEEFLLVDRVAKEYKLKQIVGFDCDDIIEQPNVTADMIIPILEMVKANPKKARDDRIVSYIAGWVISHPNDNEGHKKLLDMFDMDTCYNSVVEQLFEADIKTEAYRDFLIRYTKHKFGKKNKKDEPSKEKYEVDNSEALLDRMDEVNTLIQHFRNIGYSTGQDGSLCPPTTKKEAKKKDRLGGQSPKKP